MFKKCVFFFSHLCKNVFLPHKSLKISPVKNGGAYNFSVIKNLFTAGEPNC